MDHESEIKQPVKPLTYSSNNVYTLIITLLFSLFILINVFILVISSMLIYQIDENSISLYNALNFIDYILFIICAIFFLLWTYRANKNSHFLNPKHKFEFSPGWSIGAFFIPIFNLYWPYKVINEIRAESLADDNKVKSRVILIVWWITFLLRNGLLHANATRNPLESELAIQSFFIQSTILTVFAIISALLAIIIVRQINNAQKVRAEHLNTAI